jgi:tRNA nucleotidyltransferase (CCA-adding enzyme)
MPVKLIDTPAAMTDLFAAMMPDVATALGRAASVAADRGCGLWLIGGAVRDLLRGVALDRDIDLAVEGDAVALAAALAEALGGRVLASHSAFGTATLIIPRTDAKTGKLTLDLAGTRVEEYPQPAALPVVRPASIAEDLSRRDFSVNAIAVALLAAGGSLRAGALLDPFGGRADLAARRLRLLYPASLRDDPTRLLRGLRLASRLDLHPDEATSAQIAEALERGYLGLLTPERVLGELCLALDEPQPDAVLALADTWGATPQIAPSLAWSEAMAARFVRSREASVWIAKDADAGERHEHEAAKGAKGVWIAKDADAGERHEHEAAKGAKVEVEVGRLSAISYRLSAIHAGLLCYDLSAADLAGLAGRYPLPAPFARLLQEIPVAREIAPRLSANMRPSQIDLLLRSLSEAIISVLHYAERGPTSQIAARYLREIRPARAPLDGRDMQRLGVAPGPMIGRLLNDLRAAQLDGEVTTREQAEGWVRERL